jgi:hypothetical protein
MRGEALHRMTLLRAAPGRLLELVAAVKGRGLVLRHSQGDQWDLMVLAPVAGYADLAGAPPLADPALVAWQEDELVRGPDVARMDGFAAAGLYHVEMFVALAGRRGDLVREREMENAYLAALGRPRNAIFVRELGAAWDAFTIGGYRSWKHFAERDDIAPDRLWRRRARRWVRGRRSHRSLSALAHPVPSRHAGYAGSLSRSRCHHAPMPHREHDRVLHGEHPAKIDGPGARALITAPQLTRQVHEPSGPRSAPTDSPPIE